MPSYRSSYRRVVRKSRRVVKKRAAPRKTKTRYTKITNVKNDVHYFKRFCYKTTITGDVSRTAKGAITFSLSDLPNLSEFSNLFDYYKLSGVKLRFTTLLDSNSQTGLNSYFPKMYYAYDYDDSVAPNNSDDLRQRAGCKIRWLLPNRSHGIFIRPKYLNQIYNGVSTGYQLGKQGWLDMSDSGAPHYGLKYVIENLNNDLGQQVQVEATYYFSMRGTR